MSAYPRKKRKLACIMFTDIVGYTSLMSNNEAQALKILDENRFIHKSIINKYGGELIKEMGDGMMAIFNTATDAVHAACEIQVAAESNEDLNLRIGLHLSEIIYENGDIFGDGVNIAARIEPTAPTGGIHISQEVHANLYNKDGLATNFIREFQLKNVKQGIRIYEVIATEAFKKNLSKSISRYSERIVEDDVKSIAVMPFLNLTNDPEQDYFCDGIADDILITLSNIKELKIVGRKSSFQFKNTELSEQEIGSVLNVNHLLEGSVRRHGNRLRINVMLFNVPQNSQIWAEKYDREITDVFEIQDDITSKITRRLKVTLFEGRSRSQKINMDAYEMLLKGRYYEEMYLQGFDKALTCYTRAIEIDPDYAEAYAALANLHFLFTMHLIHSPHEGFSKTRYYAEKALSLNDEIAAAHFTLGQVNFWFDWDFDQALVQYDKAAKAAVTFYSTGITVDPWYHAFIEGDYDKAVNSALKIIETDPLSVFNQYLLSCFYTWGSRPAQARDVLSNIIKMVPNYSDAYRLLAYNSFIEGDSSRAVEEARKAVELSYGLGWSQLTLGIVLAQDGQTDESKEILFNLQESKEKNNISPLGIALIYTYLGDLDNAFKYLEEAIHYKDQWMVSLKFGPEYEPLRSDPRFDTLIDQIGYPKISERAQFNFN